MQKSPFLGVILPINHILSQFRYIEGSHLHIFGLHVDFFDNILWTSLVSGQQEWDNPYL